MAVVAGARAGRRAADLTATFHLPVRSPTPASAGLRVELDDRQEKIGYKIREAQLQKVPHMLVTGDREAADGLFPCAAARRATWGPAASMNSVRAALDEIARKDAGVKPTAQIETAQATEA